MKAKSRRRLLISSIAMLLVAMLALGTATFAWFTSSTQATANNINVYTTKSSELKISKSDLVWGDTVDYGMTTAQRYAPVSSADGATWYSAYAGTATTYTKTGSFAQVQSAAGYYWTEMLNIKNQGGQDSNVTVTVSAPTFSSVARIAIIPVANQTTSGAANMPTYTEALFKENIYGIAGDSWNPATGASTESSAAYTTQGAANGASINVGKLDAEGGQKSYRIVVWFEGQDTDCYDNYAGGFTVPAVTFTVSGTATTS